MKLQASFPPAVLASFENETSSHFWVHCLNSVLLQLTRSRSPLQRASRAKALAGIRSQGELPGTDTCDLDLVSCLLDLPVQVSAAPGCGPPDRTEKKLRSRIGDIVRHSVGKSCPALSSEPGLILLAAQVVRGSVGSPNVMVGDRLELDACDLELVCTLYLVPSTFEVSA